MPDKINLQQKLEKITEFWKPGIIGELNGQHIKLAKLKGEFISHQHENEDEMFLVLKGKLKIELPGKSVELNEGEMFIVPRGVEHRPVAEEEVHVMMFEPASTVNTGNIKNERTVTDIPKL